MSLKVVRPVRDGGGGSGGLRPRCQKGPPDGIVKDFKFKYKITW